MSKKYTQETFEEKVKEIHGDTIDLSNFVYVNSITSGVAKCNICGNVWNPRPDVLIRGCGCRKCYDRRNSEKKTASVEETQARIKGVRLHVEDYVDTRHKCSATCESCGYTWRPNVRDLIEGHGCPKCALPKHYEKNREERLEKTLEVIDKVHGDTYDLSLLKEQFKSDRCHVDIICKKHGKFNILLGLFKHGHGCPICRQSKLESMAMVSFEKNGIEMIPQYSFEWMKVSKYGKLTYDFFLPKYNIAIECQGIQHFEQVELFGGEDELLKTIKRDETKSLLSRENGIKLIYFLDEKYNKYMKDDDIYFNDVEKMIEYIKAS